MAADQERGGNAANLKKEGQRVRRLRTHHGTHRSRQRRSMAVKRQHKRRAEVHFIAPMKATLVKAPPPQGEWLYELKFDGFRTIAVKNGADVELYSRNAKEFTPR